MSTQCSGYPMTVHTACWIKNIHIFLLTDMITDRITNLIRSPRTHGQIMILRNANGSIVLDYFSESRTLVWPTSTSFNDLSDNSGSGSGNSGGRHFPGYSDFYSIMKYDGVKAGY